MIPIIVAPMISTIVSAVVDNMQNPGKDFIDYSNTVERIAALPNGAERDALREMLRLNYPGTEFRESFGRFLGTLPTLFGIPRMKYILAGSATREAMTMFTEEDYERASSKHWNEIEVPAQWKIKHNGILCHSPNLYHYIKLASPRVFASNAGMTFVGMTIALSANDARIDTANWVLSAYGIQITVDTFKAITDRTTGCLSPIPMMTECRWRKFTNQQELLVTIWILAACATFHPTRNCDAFIQLCSSMLVGPVFGLSVSDCKEGFSSLVAVALCARARRDITAVFPNAGVDLGHYSPFTASDLRAWPKAVEMVNVLQNAYFAANGTLWTGRPVLAAKGKRVNVAACNKWTSPPNPENKPHRMYSVIGKPCEHPKGLNPDGTVGTPCAGRWILATSDADLDGLEDGKVRVCLMHGNRAAVDNVLMKCENIERWVYIQGDQECLNCAYKRAIRHGFQVIIDSPNVPSGENVLAKGSFVLNYNALSIFVILAIVQTNVLFASTTSVWSVLPQCPELSSPKHTHYQWTAIAGIVTSVVSLAEASIATHHGHQYVPRSGLINVTLAVMTTALAGISGYLGEDGCGTLKVTMVLREIMLASANRLAFEKVDVLSVFISIIALLYLLVITIKQGILVLVEVSALTLLLCSILYMVLCGSTARARSLSPGTVGNRGPLLMLKLLVVGMAVYAFIASSGSPSTQTQIIFQLLPSMGMILEGMFQFVMWTLRGKSGDCQS